MKKKDDLAAAEELIDKQIVIKNFNRYTEDKALLITVLNASDKQSFSEEEVRELIQNELERVIN